MTIAPRTRVQRRPVHGLLLLDKPIGLSSNQALQKVKWLLRAEKAGHTGTLDPLATGVLPICFGAATKFSQMHLDANKRYQAVLQLGAATTTGDAEGDVMLQQPVPLPDAVDLPQLAKRMQGPCWQVPPMYSALKKDGKPLYEYAREGIDVPREPRSVELFDLSLAWSGQCAPEVAVSIEVGCSKGTYIRTLGEDIAKALGTVGHLRQLRRVQTGAYDEAQCVSLDALEAMTDEQRLQSVRGLDLLFDEATPIVPLAELDAVRFLSGLRRRVSHADAELVRVHHADTGDLLGTAHVVGGELIPTRLLNPLEIAQLHEQRVRYSVV